MTGPAQKELPQKEQEISIVKEQTPESKAIPKLISSPDQMPINTMSSLIDLISNTTLKDGIENEVSKKAIASSFAEAIDQLH